MSLRFIHKGIYEIYHPYLFETTFYWLNPIFLIAIPSFYLYYKSLLNDNKQFNYKDLFHFIYPLGNILFIVIQKNYVVLKNDTNYFLQFIILTIFIMYYLVLSFQILNRKLWKNNNLQIVADRHYHLIKNWTQFFYFITLLLALRLLFSFYLENSSSHLLTGSSYSIVGVVLWLFIFIKILINPEILYGYPKLEEKLSKHHNAKIVNSTIWQLSILKITNLQDQKLTIGIENKIATYIKDIEDFMISTHPFRDPNFSIKDISTTLSIPTSHLAYIFKYHCTMPFVEFKKYCRIEDAKVLIKDNYLKSNTLESLSNKIGFISYNTFYSAFKKYNKVSPKEYLDSIS